MDKESGDGGDSTAKPPPDPLLDPSSLFGAYWGRDGGASSAQAQAQAQAALFGFGSRYPAPSTLGVAANQAASLGLHPAASAAWWSMASHLAAQDYLARLQASGLNFPQLGDPYAALSALSGSSMKQPKQPKQPSRNERSGRSSVSSMPPKDKSPSTSTNSQHSMADWASTYGFPKTSSPSTMASQSLSSLASLNNLAQQPHHSKPVSKQSHQPQPPRKSSSGKEKERDMSVLRSELMLAQAAAQGAYHAAVAAAAKGKNLPMYPFSMGSEKDRRGGIDSLTGLPHNLLSAALEGGDPAAVLGGVRLPPDTEIIKYTSSLTGPKVPTSSTNRGRKKTISLDPPHVSLHPSSELPSKRQKLDEYGNSRSSVEVIRLPNKPDRGSSISGTPPPNLSDYAGISRELLQTIASQSGVSLAALEKQLAGTNAADSGLNLSTKSNASSEEIPLDLGSKPDDDAPLNLSLKPTPANTQASDALSRLTSLSSSLNASNDRISRRKPGAKPRRVAPELVPQGDIARPRSSGSEDSESVSQWPSREGRPRNLGRGVSKPKKNTVASLLAQSRALGLRPALAHQLLGETDLEKLRALVGEGGSTDSECRSDSHSDSDASDAGVAAGGTPAAGPQLRLPLALGWKRVTVIKGLSRNCHIKGDVSYGPPPPHEHVTITSHSQLVNFLESNPCPPLSVDNFSFNSRCVLGEYTQPGSDVDPVLLSETDVSKRLEEAKALAALAGPRSTPPLERRIELARRQQAARDARRDASARNRDQVRLVRELERSEKAEYVKREKEVRSQQILEAKRKKQEEVDKQKNEDHAKRQQEREIKRHQAMLLKEQERERRRQHTTFIRQLDSRRRWEERERRKHQNLLDRLLVKEKKLQQRRKEMELLAELRRPQEDSTLSDQKPLPTLERIPGLKLAGQAFADLLQTFEFLHNFGNSLGFVVDSLPSLDTLQQGLLPDYNNEAEDELVLLTIRLLEIALEDPGIPHPGRHTTLLGQAIRIGDITPDNLSEVLRIYLYANATGQVKALTGLTVERERERRVADHHQSDAEMQQSCMSSKNAPYYQHLHSNATYKLSETLRDKPFVSLNPTSKARILATLCDELLQNKSVLRQIDASLDHLNHLRKEKYLMDAKFRKLRVLYTRKTRSEHSEKQQALALERMQRLVEESVVTRSPLHESSDKSQTPKKESSPEKPNTPSPYKDSEDQSDKELSPLKDLSNSMKSKEMLNNNKDECPVEGKDKDSVMGDNDGNFSDLESEGTQPEEDEDKNLSSEEVGRKVERFSRQCEQHSLQLAAASTSLRAACSLQDRYWRRYWSLGKAGGIWVEAMESAQPEILSYHARLEDMKLNAGVKQEVKEEIGELKVKMEDVDSTRVDAEADALELRSIKNELNLSDRTQIIKYEPNNSACKVEGSIKMEEKYIQHKQNNEECDMLDIEDSIPTAFLVQKPHKPVPANEEEPKETKTEPVEEQEDPKDNLVNNLEELRKMAEAVSSQLVAAKKAEEQKDVKPKTEEMDTEDAHVHLYTKMLDGKWFSILRHEIGLTSINENEDVPKYCDNDKTCAEIVLSQGHRWDVSNNLHLLNDPSLFTLNSMVTSVQVPNNNIYPDSSLTMSGLDQDMIDNVSHETEFEVEKEKDQENDLEKELQADSKADLSAQKAKGLNSLGLLNFNALSTYVTCDSPPPIAMSLEELDQLDYCKVHGLPKKIEGNYVPKDLRHGWWRITDPEQVPALLSALHSRGVRERELYASLMSHLPTYNGALYVDKGDTGRTQLTVTAADQELCPASYPDPDEPGSFSAEAARRVDLRLAAMVDALEERVSAASMQVKGWRPSHSPPPPGASGADIVERARQKLAQLEAHVERRYLKPPLVQRYASTNEANLGAMLQGEHGASSGNSPQNSDSGEGRESKGIARGLSTWREAVSRCNTAAQLAMLLRALETHIAWDKSCMKANCQFCLCGDNEDQLLLCDGCDKGYHTYCFKPRMEKIPEGDWYCWECVNKARGERVCIVCGGGSSVTRLVPCALCCRAYHPACHYPPLAKNPRGKWYCAHCINRAPPKKPRKSNKRDSKNKDSIDLDSSMVPSPAASHASTSTTASECPGAQNIPDKEQDKLDEPLTEPLTEQENGHTAALELAERDESASEKCRRVQYVTGNGAVPHLEAEHEVEDHEAENVPLLARVKKDKPSAKRQGKDMLFCKNLLGEMECHEHAWPFLVPVNTKQFPQYRKVIKSPMDLSTIKRKLQDSSYKCKEEFAQDVRLIFSNCEEFNEDYSPVGRAGHTMRQFFELKWNQTEQ
ncbi:bromodomain adjacent to zinc finger domain protein 2B-like isoform X8 [Leptidea sinapis]|uniref:bromodomain adjacent to zinc finger domain protein 2B-like isoform X8 n=1 Tax=Leptidea sinapis TaxID=189913 RepID=UPI0021C31E16|nr:bromodomain adjacent to zinc finger domain protein 2B-like isoform X8 [Leptidea sinapis]